jgi:DNA-binding protein YbaB
MLGDLRRATRNMADIQRRLFEVTGTAWSEDRLIRAVVGPRGHLLELHIDPRIYRRPDSGALAASIVATVKAAVAQASARTQEIIDGYLPKDMQVGQVGGVDMRTLNQLHDADLPKEAEDV